MLPQTVTISQGRLDPNGGGFLNEKSQHIADQNEITDLFAILNDPDSFGGDGKRCFKPGMHIEYVLDGRDTKHQVCLECHWLTTAIDGKADPNKALSDKGKSRFSAIFQRLFG
ncbi:MAG TPA: hypothetical protein VHX44_14165 [Planctomycetota bacterium]|jgi:hypothetical protein|nr:hypothetical protein [Planctomycetota bacterium]